MKLNIFVFLLIWHAVLCQWVQHRPPHFCSRRESALIAKTAKIIIKNQVDTERINKLYEDNKIKLTNFADEVLSDIRKASFSHAHDTQTAKCFAELQAEAKQVRNSHEITLKTCYYGLLKTHQYVVTAYDSAMLDINRCSNKKQPCRETRKCTDRVRENFNFENEFNVFVGSLHTCFNEKYERSRGTLDYIKFRSSSCYSTVAPTGTPSTITEGVTVEPETTIATEKAVAEETTTAFPKVTDNMFIPVKSSTSK